MTIKTFLFNWIATIILAGLLGALVVTLYLLFDGEMKLDELGFPFAFAGLVCAVAIVLSLPYTLIMLSGIRWGQDGKTQDPRNFIIGLHLALTAAYLIATYFIGVTDGNPWTYMAIVGGFAAVGTTLIVRPIDHKKFFSQFRKTTTQ